MPLDPIVVYGNYAEACVWLALAAFAVARLRRGFGVALGVALVAFGLSDVVEAQTGAWYRPWWLLSWKATNVAAIAVLGFFALRRASVGRPGGGGAHGGPPA